jgi:crotonobetainyl-CoA:carnitine CoA-transferase CaiB-like acyl-CoA transferase
VLSALFEREHFERIHPNQPWGGTAVVVPMFEALTQFVLGDHMAGETYEPTIGASGYARLLTPNRKPYKTSDGYLCVLIYNDKHWQSFFGAVPEANALRTEPRFMTHTARADNINAVYAEVSRLMQSRTTAQWRELLEQADIPNMPIDSPADLLVDPHHMATGFIQTYEHPTEGALWHIGNPTKWSNHPQLGRIDAVNGLTPAAGLGQHTAKVLRELGYDEATIARMLAQR